jgi:hypothetical protein
MPTKTTARRVLHVGSTLIAAFTIAACGSTTTTSSRPDPPPDPQSAHAQREQQRREAVDLAQTQRAEAAAKQLEREAQEPLERWRALQHDLVGALVLQGGVETYERISGEAESKGRAYAASEIRTLVESLSMTRTELATLGEHTSAACATGIANALGLLERRQHTVEQTRVDSWQSEYEWANTAREDGVLELPLGHLGDGLEACDPSGTGEIEEDNEAQG